MVHKKKRPRWDSNPAHHIRAIMTERKCAHGSLSRWRGHEKRGVKQDLTVSATRRVALLMKGAHTAAGAVDLWHKKKKTRVGFEPWTPHTHYNDGKKIRSRCGRHGHDPARHSYFRITAIHK